MKEEGEEEGEEEEEKGETGGNEEKEGGCLFFQTACLSCGFIPPCLLGSEEDFAV